MLIKAHVASKDARAARIQISFWNANNNQERQMKIDDDGQIIKEKMKSTSMKIDNNR